MKKVVVKLAIHDYKEKQKALKAVSSLSGINSISVDMKEEKLTVVGDVDPVDVVSKLRKSWHADIVSVGPAKEPEKENKGGDGEKDNASKEENVKNESVAEKNPDSCYLNYDQNHNHYMTPRYVVYGAEGNPNSCYPNYMTPDYVVYRAEENPSFCVIC